MNGPGTAAKVHPVDAAHDGRLREPCDRHAAALDCPCDPSVPQHVRLRLSTLSPAIIGSGKSQLTFPKQYGPEHNWSHSQWTQSYWLQP